MSTWRIIVMGISLLSVFPIYDGARFACLMAEGWAMGHDPVHYRTWVHQAQTEAVMPWAIAAAVSAVAFIIAYPRNKN